MARKRRRIEPDADLTPPVAPTEAAGPVQQLLSLQSAIGNAAFARVANADLAPRLSRKTVHGLPGLGAPELNAWRRGRKGGHKRGGTSPSQPQGEYPMLRKGSHGHWVTTLQVDLSADAGHPVAVDGIFGNETDGAVRAFQAEEGLEADGIVGPLTWGALRRNASGGATPAG